MALDESAVALLQKLDTRHHVHDYLKTLGASDEVASLIASSEQVRNFVWNGVALTWKDTGKPVTDEPAAKSYFTKGPFKTLFVNGKEAGGDGHPQVDPVLVESARAGNLTDKGRLLRSLNGDVQALDTILAAKGDGDDKVANGANGHDNKNPFFKLRKSDGTIDKAVEKKIGEMIAVMGHKKVAEIARAAKSPAAPLGLSLTGLPLKP